MNQRTRPIHRHAASPRSGFTIIEVIVAMVGLVLVGGIILQIYDETQAAAQKMVRRQSAVDFAVSFVDQSSELLRNAVHPSSLDIDVQPAFTSDRLAVPAFGDPASNGLFLVTLRPSEAEDAEHPYEIVRKPLVGEGSGEAGDTANPFGTTLEASTPTIQFRYATEATPGTPVAYVDRLGPDQWPVLVEIAVEVPTGNEGEPAVRMKTAVIPGRLATSSGAAAVVATPTPIPSAGLREAVVDAATTAADAASSATEEAVAETTSMEAAP